MNPAEAHGQEQRGGDLARRDVALARQALLDRLDGGNLLFECAAHAGRLLNSLSVP
jgi:hypothetical protein